MQAYDKGIDHQKGRLCKLPFWENKGEDDDIDKNMATFILMTLALKMTNDSSQVPTSF